MIFDERDLEEELNEEDMKKNHKPQKNQIKIDDIINQEKSSKRTNSKQKEKTLSSKENNDKQEISVKTPREEDVKNLQNHVFDCRYFLSNIWLHIASCCFVCGGFYCYWNPIYIFFKKM